MKFCIAPAVALHLEIVSCVLLFPCASHAEVLIIQLILYFTRFFSISRDAMGLLSVMTVT